MSVISVEDSFWIRVSLKLSKKELLSEMPEYQEAKDDLEKQKARTAAVLNMTKYLRLSHYMNRKK